MWNVWRLSFSNFFSIKPKICRYIGLVYIELKMCNILKLPCWFFVIGLLYSYKALLKLKFQITVMNCDVNAKITFCFWMYSYELLSSHVVLRNLNFSKYGHARYKWYLKRLHIIQIAHNWFQAGLFNCLSRKFVDIFYWWVVVISKKSHLNWIKTLIDPWL